MMYFIILIVCHRNPADQAGLDQAFMSENLEQKFFKPGHAWTVVIRSPHNIVDTVTGDTPGVMGILYINIPYKSGNYYAPSSQPTGSGLLLFAFPWHGGRVVPPVIIGVDGGVVQIAASVLTVIFVLHVHLAKHALIVRGGCWNRPQRVKVSQPLQE